MRKMKDAFDALFQTASLGALADGRSVESHSARDDVVYHIIICLSSFCFSLVEGKQIEFTSTFLSKAEDPPLTKIKLNSYPKAN